MVYTGYIAQILDQVEHNPALARKSLRTAWEQTTAEEFRVAAVPLLRTGEGPGQRFLVSFLMQNDSLEKRLIDHTAFTREEALTVARAAHRVEPSLDVKLAMHLAGRAVEDERDAGRILEILEAISQPANLLPLMGSIMQHPHARVRSKAALLMGKGNRNAAWLRQQLSEPDDRVRANAVEALWGLDGEEASQVFLAAAHDRNQRTAINGILGLYLCGRTESLALLAEAAQHSSGAFRASAAWGMGRTQDPRFLPVLTRLVRDTEALVRSNALKAVGKIRSYRTLIERQGAFRIRLGVAVCRKDGSREIFGVVRSPGNALPLNPLHYAVEDGGRSVFRYELVTRPETESAVGVAMPHAPDLDETMAAAIEQARRQVMDEKRACDHCNVTSYSNFPAAETSAPHSGFVQALSSLFHQLPQREQRALVVIGNPMSESGDVVLKRQGQMERLIREAQSAHVRIHAIVPPVCAPIMRVALHDAATSTGGRFVETAREENFAPNIASLLLTLFPTFQLRYKMTEPCAPKVRLMVHSPGGLGECEADVSVC